MRINIQTKSDSERRAIMKMFSGLGFKPHAAGQNLNPTVDEWCDEFLFNTYPTVAIFVDRKELAGDFAHPAFGQTCDLNKAIELYTSMNGGPNPEVIKRVNALPVAKYSIKYKKENGQISEYTISQPIEKDNSKITAYAFGKGIRSFKVERILALK